MTTSASTTPNDQMPVGREQVASAILEAAADLFVERGPAATSIRDIAARAKVNHGLVFRHFGSKQQLVGAVLDCLGATTTALLRSAESSSEDVERALDRHMRVMARALLDGYPAGQLQTSFPGVSFLLDQVRQQHDSDLSARLAVANAVALQMGWRLFEPFLRSAAGIVELPDAALQRAVGAELARIIEPH